MRAGILRFLLLLGVAAYAWSAEEVVVDFENAVPLLADHKANRFPRWEEKGVVFTLARDPQQTKGKGCSCSSRTSPPATKGSVRWQPSRSRCALPFRSLPLRFPSLSGGRPGRLPCSKLSTPKARWWIAPVSTLLPAAKRRRSGTHLHDDRESSRYRLHPILRPAGRRIPRGG